MYHRIGIPSRRSPVNGQYVSPTVYRRHMEILGRIRMEVTPLEQVARHVRREERLSPRHVAITFDDGFANLYEHAFPELAERSYPATIFLVTRHLGKTNDYHPAAEDLYEPMLSPDQVREMLGRGISFGSHTRHHARLTSCSKDQMNSEIEGSREDLEELLGRSVSTFCYPYGAHNDSVRASVISAGYTLACSTLKGRNDTGVDPYRLRRINVRADTTPSVFLYKLIRARWFDR